MAFPRHAFTSFFKRGIHHEQRSGIVRAQLCRCGPRKVRSFCASGTEKQQNLSTTVKDEVVLQQVKAFESTLHAPEPIRIYAVEARKRYGLSKEDLTQLPAVLKPNPYDSAETMWRQYSLQDVVHFAKKKHGVDKLVEQFRAHVRNDYKPESGKERLYGHHQSHGSLAIRRFYMAPSSNTAEGQRSVKVGLFANSVVFTIKGTAAWFTGSNALFADTMHSAADVANYFYRLLSFSKSAALADQQHPYGYAPLRYIVADRSFMILGILGCAVPLLHAFNDIYEGHAHVAPDPSILTLSAGIFVVSGAMEFLAVKTAYMEINSQASKHNMSVRRYLSQGTDVVDILSVATFLEAASGMVSCAVGVGGLGLCYVTQTMIFDVWASALMAMGVGGVAGALLRRSGQALLGQTLPDSRISAIVMKLETMPCVMNVFDVKTHVLGAGTVRFKAEVQFNAAEVTRRMLACSPEGMNPNGTLLPFAREMHELLAKRVPASQDHAALEDWLLRSNSSFYEALAWELKNVEDEIRQELSEFRNVHIDLEPW